MNNQDQKFNTFVKQLQEVQLSHTDSQAMRERLVAYADLHEMRQPVPSPLSASFFYWRLGTVAAVLVLLVGSGVGVSYAAQNALPGQPFYQVKVSVIEPVQGALIPSTEGRAEWENVLTERRLTEASTLAAQNKLSSSTSDYLATQVAIHTDRSEQDADTLALSGDSNEALAVRSDLEARLSAHAQLLALIAPRLAIAGDASTTAQVAILYQKVNQARADVEQSRVATEVAIDASAGTSAPSPSSFATAAKMAPRATGVVATADQERQAEETALFNAHASSLLAWLPAASTTATSTATTTASSTIALPSQPATTTPTGI